MQGQGSRGAGGKAVLIRYIEIGREALLGKCVNPRFIEAKWSHNDNGDKVSYLSPCSQVTYIGICLLFMQGQNWH